MFENSLKIVNCKLIIPLLVVLVFVLSPKAVDAALLINRPLYIGLTSGLVGYWSFDGPDVAGIPSTATTPGTVYDRSGNGNNGLYWNATGTPPAIGRIGQALEFKGAPTRTYVKVSNFCSQISNNAGAISVWIKAAVITTVVNDNHYIFNCGSGHSPSLVIIGGSTPALRFIKSTSNSNVMSSPAANRWYYIVATWDTNVQRVYVDSVQTDSDAIASISPSGDAAIGTFATIPQNNNYFNGIIDDFRVYNRALTADEIKRLYKIGATLKVNKPSYTGLDSGLVGYWSFDGPDMYNNTALDRSGQGNNGTLTNGPKRAIGKIGQALEFDAFSGTHSHVQVGDKASLDFGTSDFTLSAWIKAKATQDSFPSIIHKGATAGSGSPGYWWILSSGISKFFMSNSTNRVESIAITNLRDNSWHHVSVVVDRDGMTTHYIDGIVDDADNLSSYSASDINATEEFSIGGRDTGGSLEFTGLIDDVRIYNRELSPDEIKRLYRIGATLKVNKPLATGSLTSGLVGYWSFDGPDMAGNTAFDRSGQGNNGTLTNGPVRTLGKIGQALDFDGSNDYVGMGDPTSGILDFSDTQSFTISVWSYRTGPNTIAQRLVAKNQTGAAQNGYRLIYETDDKYTMRVDDSVNGVQVTSSAMNTLNIWHHVVGVIDRANQILRLYVDGVENGTPLDISAVGSLANALNFDIGVASNLTAGSFVVGKIDDVRVYNRVLTSDEIKRLYNLGR
ncbi:hypothetical protein A2433_00615 [Candidatus Giovannonibacteria bacterium RIFOXYC1_FULL_48_8]|nr:MAG: hypothetical protein A3D61_02270 [Candidatus Giovannonibacteria bacterium RIFCSPHIGHO2_02_FULL_48_15]OGF95403.1 MAG: hypothetical protein A2433_00615 [Candidatus Giovannonibacteria bacterium RIFOXYC1_FULL_48_8]OGF96023.1 MAG: hypothetical protein A2613_00420 [Candidatus Giovannonibacteria bacterium RIFOXYD1_FULL_48_21]